ncbi:protein of unknown function DUF303 acetylesterase putative [Solidesulfovibrio fructosivorans JJ]]|uniref:Sialate O-acetylesterase domain-containing protein n=1 Tax=Solidesulfovibrio fructosivorans JJ] TaxID=596151 RepID=E1JXV8_SOLFR|nr:sialate O-acetylesterase [Solidesulfovibrio fructosivorans]EFL50881.1 protein of unknown function DUF303 acetylesterase putative [Solidesulfovibrio fructosivorans JJ]]
MICIALSNRSLSSPNRQDQNRAVLLFRWLFPVIFLLGSVGANAATVGRTLTFPLADDVVQRGPSETADVHFSLSPGNNPVRVQLIPADKAFAPNNIREISVPAGTIRGVFPAVPGGFYSLCLKGRPNTCRHVGVGEIFLVAGQSNAVSVADPGKPVVSETGRVAVSVHHGNDPEHANEPPGTETLHFVTKDHPTMVGVCWVRLGDLLVQKYKVPIGFVLVARSATNTECWNPAGGICWGPAAKALAARRFRAVLWHQGESDVMAGFPMEKSLANMRAMITASREIQPNIPWIVARNSLKNATPYAEQAVRRAQETLIASGTVRPGPDTDVLRDHPGWVGVADFGPDARKRCGELWFAPVDALLSENVTHMKRHAP